MKCHIFQVLVEENCQSIILYPAKISDKMKGKLKHTEMMRKGETLSPADPYFKYG